MVIPTGHRGTERSIGACVSLGHWPQSHRDAEVRFSPYGFSGSAPAATRVPWSCLCLCDFVAGKRAETVPLQDDSADSVPQQGTVEVQHEPGAETRHAQVSQHLRGVNWIETFNRLDFDNHRIGYDKIRAVLGQQKSLVVERNTDLSLKAQSNFGELGSTARIHRWTRASQVRGAGGPQWRI